MEGQAEERPAALDTLTTTQLDELLRQFDEDDRGSFDEHVASYGWDRATGDAVWDWFAAGGSQRLADPVGPNDHVRGPADAPATVVVYGDYQCPYTRRALNAFRALEGRIGDRFRLVYRHFPLREIHPQAEAAAELAEAAADRGRFWEVHDHLFANQNTLDPDHLAVYATQFGIPSEGGDPGHFEAGHHYADSVEEDFQGGLRSGVDGTPTIYVNGRRHGGGYDEATLQRAIELAG
jgi:protein-disulfide isomerase